MAYNLKYSVTFDSITSVAYTFQILQKDYVGVARTVFGAEGDAFRQSKDEDDPRAPIQGHKLTVKLLNDGTLPISSFYSTSDNEFKGVLTCSTTGETLSVGLLVQDDCIEDMVDYNHPITLIFTDGLGLLKDIKLNEALEGLTRIIDSFAAHVGTIAPNTVQFTPVSGTHPTLLAGDTIEFIGTTSFNTTYNVVSASMAGPTYIVIVSETVTDVNVETGSVIIRRLVGELEKLSLFDIITSCIKATGIELPFNIYANLYEITHDNTETFLTQTFINRESFKKNDEDFEDCYTVLEELFTPLRLVLMQTYGAWELKKWDEPAYLSPWPYFGYTSEFVFDAQSNFDKYFTAGIGQDKVAETGLTQKIERPYKYVKETFNYEQPESLLKNASLKLVGSLVTSYTVSEEDYVPDEDPDSTVDYNVTFSEYNATYWDPGFTWTGGGGAILASGNQIFIRVITDSLGNELERYLVIRGNPAPSDSPASGTAQPIEVTAGDVIEYSFSYKTSDSQPGNVNNVFDINLVTSDPIAPKATTNRYLDDDGEWTTTRNFSYNVPSGDNTNKWHTVTAESKPIPYDGRLYIKVGQASNANQDTWYKDFSLRITNNINNSTKIVGHTHTDTQDITIKNVSEIDIRVDDSPRNPISGTLFLPTKTNGVTDRTTRWHKYPGDTDEQRLGEIATYAALYARHKPNTIIEGDFHGLVQNSQHISAGAILKYTYFPNLNFIFGRIEIDYRNNKLSGTLYELYDDNIIFATLLQTYNFSYIYNTK